MVKGILHILKVNNYFITKIVLFISSTLLTWNTTSKKKTLTVYHALKNIKFLKQYSFFDFHVEFWNAGIATPSVLYLLPGISLAVAFVVLHKRIERDRQ